MFGYISVNKPEMKIREFAVYRGYYCGLCHRLKERYGFWGRLTLSYDMTFLIILLTGLYEPETLQSQRRCVPHPLNRHLVRINDFTDYAADMNILLSYYKCRDDWRDEKKVTGWAYGCLLEGKRRKLSCRYGEKIEKVDRLLQELSEGERAGEADLDQMAGLFGQIMAEIFACRHDEWEKSLRKMGFYLGKFIYLLDAYEDMEEDRRKGTYNPFLLLQENEQIDEQARKILTMMMAACSDEFERLPILLDAEILRNILYSGVWGRYELVLSRREKERMEKS